MDEIVAWVQPGRHERALDVATGAGHVAIALAAHVRQTVAFDLTASMLEGTLSRGADLSLVAVQGIGEKLPFRDGCFDIVTNRLAVHHFAEPDAAIRETFRVLRPGGRFLVVDTASPDDAHLALALDDLERLRDPSHCYNSSLYEWRSMLEKAGFVVERDQCSLLGPDVPLEVESWMERIRTPEENRDPIREIFREGALKDLLQVAPSGKSLTFLLPRAQILARRPG